MADLPRDSNRVPVLGGVSDLDGKTVLPFQIDHTTGGLKLSATGGGGATAFIGLSDVPNTYAGSANYAVVVNAGATGLTFVPASGTGTVTSVSVVSANGISGSVANATTTPAITLTLGAITPTSVNSVVISGSSTPTLSVTGTSSISGSHSGTSSGTNTGDQTNVSGTAGNVTGIVAPANGGTGVANNAASTITVTGAYALGLTLSNTTSLTLPTTGTLATLAGSEALTNKTLNGLTVTSSTGTLTIANAKTLTVNDTVTLGTGGVVLGNSGGFSAAASKVLTASNTLTLAGTDSTTMTFPAYSTNIADYSYGTFATAGGTTTLTSASPVSIQFTGTLNQTCVLPDATTVPLGRSYTIDNDSTGTITVNANGGSLIITLPPNTVATVVSYSNSTAGGAWDNSQYWGEIFTNGKALTVTNSLTLSGTDGTVMTFPSTSASVARTDAAQTFTGVQTFSTPIATGSVATMTSTVGGGVPTPPNDATKYLDGTGAWSVPAGGGGSSSPVAQTGGIPLTGAKWVRGYVQSSGSGDYDLYTCPANKRAYVQGVYYYNTAGTTTNAYPEVYVSSAYRQIGASLAITATTESSSVSNTGPNFVLEAGEKFTIHADATGLNAWCTIIEFDNTVKFFTARLTSFANGANTLYTVTTGKTARLYSNIVNNVAGAMGYWNNSGGNRSIYENIVPSGGSVSSANQIDPSASISTGTVRISGLNVNGMTLNSQDFINFNTDSTSSSQFAWVTVQEM